MKVTKPTLLHDIDEATYHAGGVWTPGPQVSQSGLKLLRPPSTPREFQHYLLHGMTPTRAMDKGSCAHTVVLGSGKDFVRHPPSLLTSSGAMGVRTDSKQWIAEQKLAGRIVLKHDDYDDVYGMAEAILAHPVAGELFTDPSGHGEVSAFHEATPGLWMRSRFDLLRARLVDLKTAADPHADAWRMQAWNLGYHVQDVSYRRAHMACTGADDPGPMQFIVVGSKAPYLVAVYTLDPEFERLGAERLDAALELYQAQRALYGDPLGEGVRWDGLPAATAVLSPPRRAYWDAEGVDYEPEF